MSPLLSVWSGTSRLGACSPLPSSRWLALCFLCSTSGSWGGLSTSRWTSSPSSAQTLGMVYAIWPLGSVPLPSPLCSLALLSQHPTISPMVSASNFVRESPNSFNVRWLTYPFRSFRVPHFADRPTVPSRVRPTNPSTSSSRLSHFFAPHSHSVLWPYGLVPLLGGSLCSLWRRVLLWLWLASGPRAKVFNSMRVRPMRNDVSTTTIAFSQAPFSVPRCASSTSSPSSALVSMPCTKPSFSRVWT